MQAPETKTFPNLTSAERTALAKLKNDPQLVIREADKGSAVVIMDRQRYILEADRQLGDTLVYSRTTASTQSDIE